MNHKNPPHYPRVNRIGSVLLILFTMLLTSPVWGQDKSKDLLLVHASTLELGSNGYSYSSDVTIQYIAEFLWGLLAATDGYDGAQVDYASEGYAHSLADIYYDPEHSALKASIGSGYGNVILFESEQASAYPEVMYEGCQQLSKTVLDSGGTPWLMMFRSDHIDAALYGEYAYRAANGCGVEVIPAGYAMEAAGLWGKQVSTARVKQAWLSACAIYFKITGLDPALTGYTPAYEHLEWSNSSYLIYLSIADVASLRTSATNAVNSHRTIQHYNTSYELDGSVVYRTIDVSAAPFSDTVKYFYKGSSTHEFTSERINTILNAAENDPLTASVHFLGNQNFDTRDWTVDDLALRAGTFAAQADKGLFLFVGGSQDGANAQDIIDSNQANLVPMVFDWIKSFGSAAGTSTTTTALNEQDCADLWDHYYLRGWKTIPTAIGLGRLNEKIPNFVACEDLTGGAHSTDPLLYLNASMMLASALGRQMDIPATLPIRRGDWTHAELATAIETGHDLVKELAYMSETSAFVPDSDLTVIADSLPEGVVGEPYANQLQATGGDAVYSWEVSSSSGLPSGLSLSSDGVISGAAYEEGTFGLGFKVTDGTGAFRKVGLKLTIGPNSDLPVANDDSMTLLVNTTKDILLTGTDSEGSTSNLSYAVVDGPTHGALTGTAPDLTYAPNTDFVGEDSFTFTVSDGVNLSVPATVSISVGAAQTNLEFADLDAALSGNTLVVGGSANNLVVSGAASGADYIYSVTYTGEDYDYDGLNDTLTYGVRVKAWTGGTTELGIDDPGSTTSASATIGANSAQVTINNNRFTVNGNTMPDGASLEFVMENLMVSLTDAGKVGSAVSSGFNAARLVETHNGHSHQAIFGTGTGLLGWDWNGPFYVSGISVGAGALYVSSDTSTGDNTRPFHWGVGDVDFGITVSVEVPGVDDYAAWVSSYGLIGDDALVDADVENGGAGDGYANLLEFALGMDPTVADAGLKDSMFTEEEGASKFFVYEYERRADYLDHGLSYTLVMTLDLVTPSLDPPYDVNVGDPVDGFETVTTRYLIEGDSKFVQLQVEAE